jgi:hypothetical protein
LAERNREKRRELWELFFCRLSAVQEKEAVDVWELSRGFHYWPKEKETEKGERERERLFFFFFFAVTEIEKRIESVSAKEKQRRREREREKAYAWKWNSRIWGVLSFYSCLDG